MLGRVVQALQVLPFDFVKKTDPAQLISFIQEEHPQTIALILAHLAPNQSAAVLSGLPQESRAEVARRMAIMDRTPPEVIREIERVLQTKMSSIVSQSYTAVGGLKWLVDVLNCVDRQTEKTILESLSENSPELAEEIKRMMFVFEDIVILDDALDPEGAPRGRHQGALPGAQRCQRRRGHPHLPQHVRARFRHAPRGMEFMGPVRLRAVEEAQQKIVTIIRRLEESGEIVVARGGGEELIV